MENRLLFGTAYYPEYMPYERTDQDIAMMKAAGMNTVRIAESTWSTLEPAEGIFDFSYIDRVLEKTEKAGMLVIVGTPTYAVPAWLVRKDPDIMAETSEGREKYGHRQIFDLLNPTFRKHAEIVIRKLAAHTAGHKNVTGFQIDNETKHYDNMGRRMQAGFRQYLKEKFVTTERLNEAFGLAYWSNSIYDWEDFPDMRGCINGGLMAEFEKYRRKIAADYLAWQAQIIGYPKRIWRGGTDRGCIEAPHLTKHDGWYYIMCAEGGTGYNHCVTMGRSRNVWGPYEKDPKNPILTSAPGVSYEREDPDHLKPKYYNPDSILQKSGHGSYVETPDGEVYLFYHTARPFVPELRCTLGRETAVQKMRWTEDGWLRMDEGNLARVETVESSLPECPMPKIPDFDDFDSGELGNWYYAPRIMPQSFADVKARPGYVRIRGQEARTSLNRVSILARKLTSVYARITTKMEFEPEVYQHSAGLIIYYDNMNYVNLRKYYSETLGGPALSVVQLENGRKTEYNDWRVPAPEGAVWMRLYVEGRKTWFEWSEDGKDYRKTGPEFDTTKFSDEYCKYGEFTGTMAGLTCADRMKHEKYADFDFFEYIADETKGVE